MVGTGCTLNIVRAQRGKNDTGGTYSTIREDTRGVGHLHTVSLTSSDIDMIISHRHGTHQLELRPCGEKKVEG